MSVIRRERLHKNGTMMLCYTLRGLRALGKINKSKAFPKKDMNIVNIVFTPLWDVLTSLSIR